ncbi:Manganese transporter smf1 [Kickxella alabastrina]|uniref:Manganese transporter smf1 n=1 Tax=Kickxella alabastrina TaxID=61397 RepID=A0ACC1I0F1_9FUNG|nr:Manganese transporter smf1 [Kickxella alabastrina]
MSFTPVNPKPFLQSLIGKPIIARLKWGQEYKGMLASIDSYMNMQLINAEEFQDGNSTGELPGELLIRCNNILYVREVVLDSQNGGGEDMEADEGEEVEDTRDEHRQHRRHGNESEDEQMEEGEQE